MTITPTFHFICRFCGSAFDLTGEMIAEDEGDECLVAAVADARDGSLEAAKCLDDTCSACMSIHHERAAKELDFQAEKDLS